MLADALDRWVGRNDKPRPPGMERAGLREAVTGNDAKRRAFYAVSVSAAWFALGVASLVLMLAIAIPVDMADDRAGDYAVGVFLGLLVFCCAGVANALWRLYWCVPQARRRLAKYGPDSEEFAKSMRRTLPHNSSLTFQAAVAVLAFVLTVS